MEKASIFVCIYSAYKPGVAGSRGPDGLKQYVGVAGISGLSCRPEFYGLQRGLPSDSSIMIDKAVGGLGSPPYRKCLTIELPNGVHYGDFRFANLDMRGLHSDFSARDGMGPCVGVWTREAVVFDGNQENAWEDAIDKAIASGIVLWVPTENGGRAEMPAKILSVSEILGDRRKTAV